MIKPKKVSKGQMTNKKLVRIIFGKSGTGKSGTGKEYYEKRKKK